MSKVAHIFNYLDTLTVEDVLKYAAQGFELTINDGHVQALTLKRDNQEKGEEYAERI